ncbi:MAG TPA: hypothetical protein VK689_07245 [Armatimonadota bacterium]|nr:hypothetical protein [Armatimonadota bacterium]
MTDRNEAGVIVGCLLGLSLLAAVAPGSEAAARKESPRTEKKIAARPKLRRESTSPISSPKAEKRKQPPDPPKPPKPKR